MIEAMRTTLKLLDAPVFEKDRVKMIGVPEGTREEDIWVSCATFSLGFLALPFLFFFS
jgi:hypothetical protein